MYLPDSDDSPSNGEATVVAASQLDDLPDVEDLAERIIKRVVEGWETAVIALSQCHMNVNSTQYNIDTVKHA